MCDHRRWTPLPIPSDVIECINVLAKSSQVGIGFTNMRNEVYDEDDDDNSDGDSDDDSDNSDNSDDGSSDGKYDDYDDFIAGVDTNNSDPPDPPNKNADEDLNATSQFSIDTEDISKNDADAALVVPTTLKNLMSHTGALPPVIQSRKRQQAQETGEILVTGENTEERKTVNTVTKKHRKSRKELQIQLLKREEEENERKLRKN
jgi:hypothetical protein